MTGRWTWQPEKYPKFWMTIGSTKTSITVNDSLDIHIIEKTAYFDDRMNIGSMELLLTEQEYQVKISELGPDLLTDDIDFSTWYTAIKTVSQNQQICKFLLNQAYFCGIGNYLKAEILYRSCIRPDRCLKELTDEDIKILLLQSTTVIREAFTNGGLTIRDYLDPEGNKGTFQCQVYGQLHDPNGYEVQKYKFKDGRITHWVPQVQV